VARAVPCDGRRWKEGLILGACPMATSLRSIRPDGWGLPGPGFGSRLIDRAESAPVMIPASG